MITPSSGASTCPTASKWAPLRGPVLLGGSGQAPQSLRAGSGGLSSRPCFPAAGAEMPQRAPGAASPGLRVRALGPALPSPWAPVSLARCREARQPPASEVRGHSGDGVAVPGCICRGLKESDRHRHIGCGRDDGEQAGAPRRRGRIPAPRPVGSPLGGGPLSEATGQDDLQGTGRGFHVDAGVPSAPVKLSRSVCCRGSDAPREATPPCAPAHVFRACGFRLQTWAGRRGVRGSQRVGGGEGGLCGGVCCGWGLCGGSAAMGRDPGLLPRDPSHGHGVARAGAPRRPLHPPRPSPPPQVAPGRAQRPQEKHHLDPGLQEEGHPVPGPQRPPHHRHQWHRRVRHPHPGRGRVRGERGGGGPAAPTPPGHTPASGPCPEPQRLLLQACLLCRGRLACCLGRGFCWSQVSAAVRRGVCGLWGWSGPVRTAGPPSSTGTDIRVFWGPLGQDSALPTFEGPGGGRGGPSMGDRGAVRAACVWSWLRSGEAGLWVLLSPAPSCGVGVLGCPSPWGGGGACCQLLHRTPDHTSDQRRGVSSRRQGRPSSSGGSLTGLRGAWGSHRVGWSFCWWRYSGPRW